MLLDLLSNLSRSKHCQKLGKEPEGFWTAQIDVPGPWMEISCSLHRSVSQALFYTRQAHVLLWLPSLPQIGSWVGEQRQLGQGCCQHRGACVQIRKKHPSERITTSASLDGWITKPRPPWLGKLPKGQWNGGLDGSPHSPTMCKVQPPLLKQKSYVRSQKVGAMQCRMEISFPDQQLLRFSLCYGVVPAVGSQAVSEKTFRGEYRFLTGNFCFLKNCVIMKWRQVRR